STHSSPTFLRKKPSMSALLSKHNLRTPGHQPQQAVTPLPELPADRRRGPTTGFSAARMPLEIPPSLAESIRGFGTLDGGRDARAPERGRLARYGATPIEFVAAALQTFLFRYTGESDLLIGFRAGWIRCDLSGEPTFREVLDRVRAAITPALLGM